MCFCYLFSEIKCTLVRFLKCVIGSSLARLQIEGSQIKMMQTEDLIVRKDGPAKLDIEIKSDWLSVTLLDSTPFIVSFVPIL